MNPDGDEAALALLGLQREAERLALEFRLSSQQAAGLRDDRDRLRAALEKAASDIEEAPRFLRIAHTFDAAIEGLSAIAKRLRAALSGEPSPAHETSGCSWQPIEMAPKDGRTLLLGYYNACGKWRTLRGQWFSRAEIDEWENGESCDEGWYETSVEADDIPSCWATEPTHWQPTPRPPLKASAHRAEDAAEQSERDMLARGRQASGEPT